MLLLVLLGVSAVSASTFPSTEVSVDGGIVSGRGRGGRTKNQLQAECELLDRDRLSCTDLTSALPTFLLDASSIFSSMLSIQILFEVDCIDRKDDETEC